MKPASTRYPLVPSATETMAELAWRYGEAGLPCKRQFGICWFVDGSCMTRWGVDTPRGVRHTMDLVRERMGVSLEIERVDWSAA